MATKHMQEYLYGILSKSVSGVMFNRQHVQIIFS